MLNSIGWLIKLSLFTIAILLAGDWIAWDGRTLSQHLHQQVLHADKSSAASYLRGLTRQITEDARSGYEKKIKTKTSARAPLTEEITDRTALQAAAPRPVQAAELHPAAPRTQEKLPPSERQKLRALIQELNGPSG